MYATDANHMYIYVGTHASKDCGYMGGLKSVGKECMH